jgi:hypothetical protein
MSVDNMPHPAIQKMLSAGDAIREYERLYEGENIAPTFLSWWYSEEVFWDKDRNPILLCRPDFHKLSFDEWVAVRNIPNELIAKDSYRKNRQCLSASVLNIAVNSLQS